jgi:hypothetical protein
MRRLLRPSASEDSRFLRGELVLGQDALGVTRPMGNGVVEGRVNASASSVPTAWRTAVRRGSAVAATAERAR